MLALWVVVAAAAPVHAAPKNDEAGTLAKQYFKEATTAYDLGDFPKAIEKYKKAYEVKNDPVFLYNIAQAYRLSNNFQQAIFFYKSYLRNNATAANQAEVEGRIKDLEAQLAKQRESATAPPIGPVTTPTGEEPGTEPDEDEEGTTIPSPDKVAEGADTGATSSGPTDRPAGKPIYKKWWFWGGIGAVVATGVIIAVVASSDSGGAPDTALGDFRAP
ncbi:MAG: tetratricopeptide repeat protein [Deltaproteobacteria bacterium]|nr:tetratricopeptide repeat protein [Deltaproteobacteria bacterium]